jgi:transcriptional regulator with GAF, ATPase, and Fis domain
MCIIKLHMGELYIRQGELGLAEKHAKNALRLATAMDATTLISKAHLLLGQIHSRNSQSFKSRAVESPDGEAACIENAFRELGIAYRTIESNGQGETALRAQHEMCMLCHNISRPGDSFLHARKAYECIGNLESQIPADMFSAYYSVFDRARIKADVVRIVNAERERSPKAVSADFPDDEKSRILLRVSATVNSIQALDPLLEAILDQLIAAMGVQRALVYLRDESTGKLQLTKGRDFQGKSLENAEAVNQLFLADVIRQGNPIVSANLCEDLRVPPGSSGRALCAPLKTAGRVIGLLYADHPMPVGGLSESTINLFAAFCNLSAIAIDNARAHQRLLKEKNELEQFLLQVREGYGEIIGKSASVEAMRKRIGMAAASPLDILIVGESGTGKELIARAIHRTGRRKSEAFMPVDCGSLSDSLAEAELFGYRKGAFTGAIENRQGLLEAAHGGIIFLDEISNLPFRLQAKLLRVLQEREVRRIGETAQRKIDVQVIAATNRDLLNEIRLGRFRKDLYYRLHGMEIRVPSLRERQGDISLLIQFFLDKTAELEGGRFKIFSPEAMALLSGYSYPGNIRELKNIVASSYYSTIGAMIEIKELPSEIRRESLDDDISESISAGRIYREIQETRGNFEDLIKNPFSKHKLSVSVLREIIRLALKDSGGRYREAFARLGVAEKRYSITMQFLKRNKCYLDFRPFRRK